MHRHDRRGEHDAEQEKRYAGGLAIEEKVRQGDQGHGNADAAAITWQRFHERTFLAVAARPAYRGRDFTTKGSSVAVGRTLGGSTSHQPSLRNR